MPRESNYKFNKNLKTLFELLTSSELGFPARLQNNHLRSNFWQESFILRLKLKALSGNISHFCGEKLLLKGFFNKKSLES